MLYLGPVRRAAYGGTRPAVWPLMMVPGVRTGPWIERGAQAGIEPAWAPGPHDTSAPPKRYGSNPHTCALECGNVTLSAIPSRIGPGAQTQVRGGSLDVEPRGAASPNIRGGTDPGVLGQTSSVLTRGTEH